MFGSTLVKMNTSYLNSNSYGSGFNLNMSYGYSMPSYSCNSVFNAGVSFTPAGYSSMCCPGSYAAVMPSPLFGGFCGGFGNLGWFGAIPFMQNFMDMMTAFSTLSTTNSITGNYINKGKSNSNPAVSSSGYSPSYTPFSNTFSWMPTLNFSTKTNSASRKKSTAYTFHTSSFNTKSNLPALKDAGYDEEKGYNLAKTAAGNAVGFTHKCAKYVRIALEKNGLSNGMRGDGYEYANILSRNSNFKEISTKNVDLSSLPAGCILVYGQGVAGYDSKAGHVEITLGNGQAVSDGVTNNIRQGARVFVPVSA